MDAVTNSDDAGLCDIFQVGARNMQNYFSPSRAWRIRKPVLLKRGMSATMKSF